MGQCRVEMAGRALLGVFFEHYTSEQKITSDRKRVGVGLARMQAAGVYKNPEVSEVIDWPRVIEISLWCRVMER